MTALEVDQLLEEVSPTSPSGADLRFDPSFAELERAAAGKPEQRIGESVIPGQGPDWQDIRGRSVDLLRRTKDLRVAAHLVRSLLHTDGLVGLGDGLALVGGLLERHWDTLYPRIDPEDGNDPTSRLNSLANLGAFDGMVKPLREWPLVTSRVLGRITLRAIEIADGTIPRPEGGSEEFPDPATVSAAFSEADSEELRTMAASVRGALDSIAKILGIVADRLGSAGSVDLSRLTTALKRVDTILSEQLARRGSSPGAPTDGAADPARGPVLSGEITSREDVIRVLEKACDYFRRHEPSSPVPLLLERAKKLVPMSFLEIVEEMASGGLDEVRAIGGIAREE